MMRLLASFMMQGRWQAAVMASALAVLSWLLPLAGVLSASVIALVTLRRGFQEGVYTTLLATAVSGLIAWLLLGDMVPAFGVLALLWVPAGLVAIALRTTRSLAFALQGALLFGVAMIAAYYAYFPDPVAEWRSVLESFSQSLTESQLIDEAQRGDLLESVAPWMTGILAALYYLQLAAALLLARWWQSQLYNPGGFRQEFHGLRLHRLLAYAALPVMALAMMSGLNGAGTLINYAAVLLMSAYFLQGLALAHGIVAQAGASSGWLAALYVLLVLAMPHMFAALFVAGYADAWFDFRARFQAGGKAG